MKEAKPIRHCVKASEEGYILLMAVFLLALVVISLAIAAPQVAKSIQRDKDLETYHHGLQYRRAIQLYYRKFHAYPPNVDALVKTNEIRFLRKKYDDPVTGKVDWKPVLFGQNKTPTAMGFFGQPLAGGATTIAGIGPSGGNPGGLGGSVLPGGISSVPGGNTQGTLTVYPDNTGTYTSGSSGANASGNSNSTTGAAGGGGSASDNAQSGQSSGQNGQTFGGAGIIGFEPASPKKSILIYKKKDHYNEWEFTYDPISEMQTIGGGNIGANGLPGSPNGQPGQPGNSGQPVPPGSSGQPVPPGQPGNNSPSGTN